MYFAVVHHANKRTVSNDDFMHILCKNYSVTVALRNIEHGEHVPEYVFDQLFLQKSPASLVQIPKWHSTFHSSGAAFFEALMLPRLLTW